MLFLPKSIFFLFGIGKVHDRGLRDGAKETSPEKRLTINRLIFVHEEDTHTLVFPIDPIGRFLSNCVGLRRGRLVFFSLGT